MEMRRECPKCGPALSQAPEGETCWNCTMKLRTRLVSRTPDEVRREVREGLGRAPDLARQAAEMLADREERTAEQEVIVWQQQRIADLERQVLDLQRVDVMARRVVKAKGRHHSQLALCDLMEHYGLPCVRPGEGVDQ